MPSCERDAFHESARSIHSLWRSGILAILVLGVIAAYGLWLDGRDNKATNAVILRRLEIIEYVVLRQIPPAELAQIRAAMRDREGS